jgi:hypothetical protein
LARGGELLHLLADFRLYLCSDLVTVKDGGSHSFHGNKYLNHKKDKGTLAGEAPLSALKWGDDDQTDSGRFGLP